MFIADPPLLRAPMNRVASDSLPVFTPRQDQYLAFIHACTMVNGRPPAQADIQRFFQITPPSVHRMLLTLERGGLISRRPDRAAAGSAAGKICRRERVDRKPAWR
jgi:Mn-dependent DtxR family transcriptional regulator